MDTVFEFSFALNYISLFMIPFSLVLFHFRYLVHKIRKNLSFFRVNGAKYPIRIPIHRTAQTTIYYPAEGVYVEEKHRFRLIIIMTMTTPDGTHLGCLELGILSFLPSH